jgi:acyl-CoA synthetase (AMP-forming)/AMP-acid ligase II
VSPRFDNLMMNYPLTLTHFFERSRRLFGRKTIATRVPGQAMFRYTYADFAARTMRLAGALATLGVRRGERVATFAWNSHRHLELYWATPLSGAVLHTLNIRLSPLDLTYIINHAGDSIIFADASLWPVLAAIRDKLPSVRKIVIMPDGVAEAATTAGREHAEYEALLADARPVDGWPELGETDAAGMCYTSGTTGHPKGVVYTHRAMFLHCLAEATADLFAISEADRILHIVPMFHANSWCLPYTALMVGADQIFAGANPQPPDICRMIQSEKITFTGAVPTVWIAIKELCEKEGYDISSLRTIAIGGSAAPRSLQQAYAKNFGVQMSHAWGMTEMTPLGTVTRLKSYMEHLIMSHPKVLEAAVIAVPHPKWVERPLACVVPKPGSGLEPGEIIDFLRPQLARWALPDAVEIIEAVPKTSVGKFDKKVLRERYKSWSPREA